MHNVRNSVSRATLAMLLAGSLVTLVAGCSSAPKRPPEVFTNRNAATGQLDMASQAVAKREFASAQVYLDKAWNLAVSTDDTESRINVLLARGNAWFNQGNTDKANDAWNQALSEATTAGDKTLTAIGKIYLARGSLPEGNSASQALSADERKAIASHAKATVTAEMPNVKANQLYTAFAWRVIGLAAKEEGNATEAEKALQNAVSIHDKGRYLEDAAYDWYLIASVRSKAGQYESALQAIATATAFDRRAENTSGLGMDWLAAGKIAEKAGDTAKAMDAYRRAAEIFNAGFQKESAAEAEKRIAALETVSGK
jgi:tetratricopeptide (TPR) repeat protein